MAETKLVVVDFEKYPDLHAALESLVIELDTDKSKLIRQLVRERVEEHAHTTRVEKAMKSQLARLRAKYPMKQLLVVCEWTKTAYSIIGNPKILLLVILLVEFAWDFWGIFLGRD